MAFKVANVTLSGNTRITSTHTPVRQVIVYNPTGNGAVTVGTSTQDGSASFGFSIAAASAGPALGPFSGELPMNLEDIYLKGTDAQVVHVTYIT